MNHCGNGKTNAPASEDGPTIMNALCVLASATVCGTNPDALAARSGIRLDLVIKIADRMRNAGIWSDDSVDQSELWDASGDFNARALFCQAQVAAGLARRVVTDAGVEYVMEPGVTDDQK
jgi:hypothetical protein